MIFPLLYSNPRCRSFFCLNAFTPVNLDGFTVSSEMPKGICIDPQERLKRTLPLSGETLFSSNTNVNVVSKLNE